MTEKNYWLLRCCPLRELLVVLGFRLHETICHLFDSIFLESQPLMVIPYFPRRFYYDSASTLQFHPALKVSSFGRRLNLMKLLVRQIVLIRRFHL